MIILCVCRLTQLSTSSLGNSQVHRISQTVAVTYLLESRGFLGRHLCTTSLSLSWIQLDTDLLTLNLPTLFSDYYLYKDYCWPHYMGMELGRLLKLTSESDLAPMGCRIHAFGEASHVVAAGIRLYCIQSGLVSLDRKVSTVNGTQSNYRSNVSVSDESVLTPTSSLKILGSQSSSTSLSTTSARPPPLVLVFSRGQVELPPECADESTPQKQILDSTKLHYYKDIRDVHISRVHSLLLDWRGKLQDSRGDLEMQLVSQKSVVQHKQHSSSNSIQTTSTINNTCNLRNISTRLGSFLAKRRELSFLLACLEQVLCAMTIKERVEDLRTAQSLLLQSGSGGSLAIGQVGIPSIDDENDDGDSNAPDRNRKFTPVSIGGSCGNLADVLNSFPMRLAIEWLTTHHGDHLIDGLRLVALNCVLHDGLGDELYEVMSRAIIHAAGQITFPMLEALSSLGLLYPRSKLPEISSAKKSVTNNHPTDPQSSMFVAQTNNLTKKSSHTLTHTVAKLKLTQRQKSRYNYLHHLLQLSNWNQANRHVDRTVISPTYVYSGQHCPLVVRLLESVWSAGLLDSKFQSVKSNSSSAEQNHSDFELIAQPQLIEALKRMGLPSEVASNLGLVNLCDPTLTAAGYQHDIFFKKNRPNAPAPHPLPLISTDQPIVVAFPGGCTYGEVAALRFVAKRRRWNLLIATSCILTSRDLLQQAGKAAMNVNSL
ncbi:vacuolar protein sorting-associated protein 33 [Schistosoma bovis]|uniref:Vacuolar protein sorting-associated protein 33 n=1 Tax=Schistosoma bovis TaxID=6184 RepID=A0A430QDH9_SCHBO|nr:vacuolar protein sorting-associated protein 33 [Schistosoma bovis]